MTPSSLRSYGLRPVVHERERNPWPPVTGLRMGLYGRGGPRVRLTGKFYRADAGYAYTGTTSRSDLAGSLHAKLGVSPGIPGL